MPDASDLYAPALARTFLGITFAFAFALCLLKEVSGDMPVRRMMF